MQVAPTVTDATPLTDAEAVAAAVTSLGPLDREALLLRLRGRSLDQIAAATGTTNAMVRVRLHRAAAAVERRVGAVPADGSTPAGQQGRPTDEVVTDAEVGITPVLHARLMAALRHTRPTRQPRFRRLAEVVQVVVEHGPQLVSVGGVAALAVTTTAALVSAV